MGSYSIKNHKRWLIKADNDFNAAKLLYKADYLDVAVYHTRDSREKKFRTVMQEIFEDFFS